MRCVTYGCGNRFEPEKFEPVKNIEGLPKPSGGLWGSPEHARSGWWNWCRENGFEVHRLRDAFRWTLGGRVLAIDSLRALLELHREYRPTGDYGHALDFEALKLSYDAVHLTARGQCETRYSNPSLYGWDCESVLVLNISAIQ